MPNIRRRSFLQAAAIPMASLLADSTFAAKPQSPNGFQPPICIFSKHLQFLNYEELAIKCKEIGLDGVDLTVRPNGHVLLENVGRDLPRAVELIRAAGLQVPMITTNLVSGNDPTARAVLQQASKLGIKYFRIGGHKYDGRRSPMEQLPRFIEDLKSLAQVAEEFNMSAGYHNHSGKRHVGGPIWDLHHMLQQVDSDRIGSNFDVGHATVEGAGGAWESHTRLMASRVKMMAVKDFVWQDNKVSWVRLGSGIVPLVQQLKIMKQAHFSGPISIHVEYPTNSQAVMVEEIRQSAHVLRNAVEATA